MRTPRFLKVCFADSKPFDMVKVEVPYFTVPWHFHPEIEIKLVLQGSGTRFVGDSVEKFGPMDLVMLGPNLAHVWKNSADHYEAKEPTLAKAIYIVFRQDSFGPQFFDLPELKQIRELILRSYRGIRFSGEMRDVVADKMISAQGKNGMQQFIDILELLQLLAESNEYTYLSSPAYEQRLDVMDLHRLDGVLNYIMRNFKEDITLDEVSKVGNMSPTAFCRYFKDRTGKTLIQFVNEIRIEHADKLLRETDLTIEQISLESGYKNPSNFYQQFQKLHGASPLKVRKVFQETLR